MMQIARVIPSKKLPRIMDFFDYLIPVKLVGKIKTGDFVLIPFKTRTIIGLVHSFADKTEFSSVKEIIDTSESIPAFNKSQFEFLQWFSEYYYYSLGSTLKLLLSEPPKRKSKITEREIKRDQALIAVGVKIKKITEQIMSSVEKKFLLLPLNKSFKTSFFLELAEKCVSENTQILLIFPQVFKAIEFHNNLPPSLITKACLMTAESRGSKTRYFENWKKIQAGKIKVVVGTRTAIFAPLTNLRMIVIDDAHSGDLKQWDQNPRYDTISVARKIQELNGCKMIISSITPRVEDAYVAKQESYKLITLGEAKKVEFSFIDLNNERKNKFTYLSEELILAIARTLKENRCAILVVNKKGEYSYLACLDCGFEANCDNCQLPMSVFGDKLICYRCRKERAMLLVCPNCHGQNLRKLGIGISQIKNELNKLFNGQATVLEDEKPVDQKIVLTNGQNVKQDDFKGVGLLGFVYTDSLVYLSDFNSSFRLYSYLKELCVMFRANAEKNQTIIVQTCFPDNFAYNSLAEDYEKFYRQEISQREIFGYPPFSTLIKIFFDHHDQNVCKKEAFDLHEKMRKALIRKKNVKITEPYPCYTQMIRKRYRYQMVLFISGVSQKEESEFMSLVPEHWMIDKDPINLL